MCGLCGVFLTETHWADSAVSDARTRRLPLLMLTARGEPLDRIVGLELGADDYLTKPFSPRELVARVRALLRRTQGRLKPPALIRLGGLEVDLEGHRAALDGASLRLTPNEFRLLALFAQRASGERLPQREWIGVGLAVLVADGARRAVHHCPGSLRSTWSVKSAASAAKSCQSAAESMAGGFGAAGACAVAANGTMRSAAHATMTESGGRLVILKNTGPRPTARACASVRPARRTSPRLPCHPCEWPWRRSA